MDEQADYQSDLLFHGLRSIFGEQCVDVPKKDYMYDTYDEKLTKQLWGRGFTYSRTLEDIPVDRTLSPKKADLVIFSIHHSVQFLFDYQLHEFCKLGVDPNKVAVVDGHDWPKYNEKLAHLAPNFFKRELDDNALEHIHPVWFGIPKEKVVTNIPKDKKRAFARIYPGSTEPHWPKNSRASHKFDNEEDYYREYQESMFAFTCKKGGWDCMRHWEIIANGCLPIFTDIEDCPKNTCLMLPKKKLSEIKSWKGLDLPRNSESLCYGGHLAKFDEASLDKKVFDYKQYEATLLAITTNCWYHYSSESLARFVLRRCNVPQS